MATYELHLGDCLDYMRTLPDGCVDAVVTDPPYGTTACAWDSVIPLQQMWEQLQRVVQPNGAIVLFASQPFASALVMSNPTWFRDAWVWEKSHATRHLDCWKRPMLKHEDIVVFGGSRPNYYPQLVSKNRAVVRPAGRGGNSDVYNGFDSAAARTASTDTAFPHTILRFPSVNSASGRVHPTQKPVALMEYLIRTYTNEGDTVLDFTMGSGTTGVACAKTGRRFIGCEIDPNYYAIAERRISEAAAQLHLFPTEGSA